MFPASCWRKEHQNDHSSQHKTDFLPRSRLSPQLRYDWLETAWLHRTRPLSYPSRSLQTANAMDLLWTFILEGTSSSLVECTRGSPWRRQEQRRPVPSRREVSPPRRPRRPTRRRGPRCPVSPPTWPWPCPWETPPVRMTSQMSAITVTNNVCKTARESRKKRSLW